MTLSHTNITHGRVDRRGTYFAALGLAALGAAASAAALTGVGRPEVPPQQPPGSVTPADSGQTKYGSELRRMAAQLMSRGETVPAQRVLDEVVRSASRWQDAAEAYRMKGLIYFKGGWYDDALAQFERQLAIYDEDPARAARGDPAYASGVNLAANAAEAIKSIEYALEINARILGEHHQSFDPWSVQAAAAFSVRLHQRLGRWPESIQAVEHVFAWYPNLKAERPGYAIDMLVASADAANRAAQALEYQARLEQLWYDPVLGEQPRSIEIVGHRLIACLQGRQDLRWIDVAQEGAKRIIAHGRQWSRHDHADQAASRYSESVVRRQLQNYLRNLQSVDAYGRPDVALWSIEQLLAAAGTPEEINALLDDKQILMKRLQQPVPAASSPPSPR